MQLINRNQTFTKCTNMNRRTKLKKYVMLNTG